MLASSRVTHMELRFTSLGGKGVTPPVTLEGPHEVLDMALLSGIEASQCEGSDVNSTRREEK